MSKNNEKLNNRSIEGAHIRKQTSNFLDRIVLVKQKKKSLGTHGGRLGWRRPARGLCSDLRSRDGRVHRPRFGRQLPPMADGPWRADPVRQRRGGAESAK